MLETVISDDGSVVTVYSSRIAIGGLTAAPDGSWYWALFAFRKSDLDLGMEDGLLGDGAPSREEAFDALCVRWSAWLDAAGLAPQAREVEGRPTRPVDQTSPTMRGPA